MAANLMSEFWIFAVLNRETIEKSKQQFNMNMTAFLTPNILEGEQIAF